MDILDILEQKIYNVINQQLKKHIKPTIEINKVTDIDIELVKHLKSKYGIGGIVLDVDETIRKDMKQIPECNKKWVEFMKEEFKVIILSNGFDGNVKKFVNEKGIEYIGFAKKPKKTSFINACDKMGLNPENVLVIGNDVISDIYGGNRCGMLTAIVKDVSVENIR